MFKRLFFRFVGSLLWKEEGKRPTGVTTLLIGALICAIFLSKQIVITVLLFLSFGDTFAYLVGHTIGKIRVCGEKTLEGALAFLGTGIVIIMWERLPSLDSLFSPHLSGEPVNLLIGLIGAVAGCIVELLPWNVDDNLSIPIISGIVMQILLIIL